MANLRTLGGYPATRLTPLNTMLGPRSRIGSRLPLSSIASPGFGNEPPPQQILPGTPVAPTPTTTQTPVPAAVPTGGGLAPQPTATPMPTSSALPPINIAATSLPALDGNRYVATGSVGPAASVGNTVGNLAQQFAYDPANIGNSVKNFAAQFAYQPGESPTTVAQRVASQFNTTPDQLPAEIVQGINAAFQQQQRDPASQVALDAMDSVLSNEGSYIRNARRRGLEQVNARGGLNASIGAGASQRAAIDAAQPMFQEIMGLNNQREGQDFQSMMQSRQQAFGLTSDREQRQFQRDMTGMEMAGQFEGMDRAALIQQAEQQFALAGQLEGQEREAALAQARDAFNAAQALSGQREQNQFAGQQSALDRTQGVNNMVLGSELDQRNMALQNRYNQETARLDAQLRQQLQSDTVAQQEWLSDRQFQREFNGALSTMAIGSTIDLNRAIMDYAAQNPEIYTPEIISGMSNFFQMNMTGLLEEYFPDLMGGNG